VKGILKITAVSALLLAAVFALSFVPASEAARAQYPCSDTDGWDTSVQGTVSGYTYEQPYSYTDSCATGSSVIEWYCAGEHACNVTLNCMNETTTCLNGACI
jgi:hypothetical protein